MILQYNSVQIHNKTVGRFILNEKQIYITDMLQEFHEYKDKICELHTHDFYIIAWVEHGGFNYQVGLNEYYIGDNTLLLLSPGDIHSFCSIEKIRGISINFTENYFLCMPNDWSCYIKYKVMHGLPYLELTSNESRMEIKRLFEILQREFDNFSVEENNYIGIYSVLTMFLYRISKMQEFRIHTLKTSNVKPQFETLYFTFLNKLEKDYCKFHLVQYYSKELGVSVNKLGLCCKEYAGLKPLEIINNRIILEAKWFLMYSSMRSNEISSALGFTEQSHFVNFFKRITGFSPTEFRKQFGRK